jgi:hypothetical protein
MSLPLQIYTSSWFVPAFLLEIADEKQKESSSKPEGNMEEYIGKFSF